MAIVGLGCAACGRLGFPNGAEQENNNSLEPTKPKPEPPPPITALTAAPSAFNPPRFGSQGMLTVRTQLTRVDNEPLLGVTVGPSAEHFLEVASFTPSGAGGELVLNVSTENLEPGSHQIVAPIHSRDNRSAGTLEFNLNVLQGVHIGPFREGCSRPGLGGQTLRQCDYAGRNGLQNAMRTNDPQAPLHIVFYGTGAGRTAYLAASIPGGSRLNPSLGTPPDHIELWCTGQNRLRFSGDGAWMYGLTVVARENCSEPIATEPNTGSHLVENVRIFGAAPETFGANSIHGPFKLGEGSTIRNSHMFGYIENSLFDVSSGSRLIGNTIVYYQAPHQAIELEGREDITIANNVFVSLSRRRSVLFSADDRSTRVVIEGNAMEGFDQVITGLAPGDPSNRVDANIVAPVELDAPSAPQFLSDSSQRVLGGIQGEGQSLDGVDLAGRTNLRPGAYQVDATRTLPRAKTIRVGAGNCGASPCDVSADEENEIQKAVWRAWPGVDIEIFPASEPYAGNAVVSWRLNLIGMGGAASEVVLQSREEDETLAENGTWSRRALLSHIFSTSDPMNVDNMTLQVHASSEADEYAIFIESMPPGLTRVPHQLRRLHIESLGSRAGLVTAMHLGHNVIAQDILIEGEFGSCARLGSRRSRVNAPHSGTAHLLNITCRLQSSAQHATRAVFEIAATDGSQFANIVAEVTDAVPIFDAQRRSQLDTGPKALDPPIRFFARSISSRGHSQVYGGFDDTDGTYDTIVDSVAALDPLFVSPSDAHLAVGAAPLDSGTDLTTLPVPMVNGVSIDGVARNGATIDRGAHEQ